MIPPTRGAGDPEELEKYRRFVLARERPELDCHQYSQDFPKCPFSELSGHLNRLNAILFLLHRHRTPSAIGSAIVSPHLALSRMYGNQKVSIVL